MALKVCFVITDLHRGGSPLVLLTIARGLLRRGFDVEVISLAGKGEVGEMLEGEGVPVVALEAAGARDWRVLGKLVRRLREKQPRIVCSILVHANVLAAMARKKLERAQRRAGAAGGPQMERTRWVQSIHTVQEKPRWHWWVQGKVLPRADVFVAPSQAVVEKVLRSGKLAPGASPEVIPNGFDVRRFLEAAPIEQSERPWPVGSFVVGYIGRFDRVKRLELLIEAAGLLLRRDPDRFENLHVALVGYGREEARLRKFAEARGLLKGAGASGASRVHFVGPSTQPERWYKVFDAFCSPSAAEGFGMTLAEAMVAAHGRRSGGKGARGEQYGETRGVLIACDTPAVRETVAGAIWLPEDAVAQDVANGIEAAFEGGGAGESTRAGAPELADRFDQETMVDRYAALFLKLAAADLNIGGRVGGPGISASSVS